MNVSENSWLTFGFGKVISSLSRQIYPFYNLPLVQYRRPHCPLLHSNRPCSRVVYRFVSPLFYYCFTLLWLYVALDVYFALTEQYSVLFPWDLLVKPFPRLLAAQIRSLSHSRRRAGRWRCGQQSAHKARRRIPTFHQTATRVQVLAFSH